MKAKTEVEHAPPEIREELRSAILASIKRDVELRGGRTARLLATAGIVGVLASIGVTLFISGHPLGHHPPWHVAVFSAVWTGLLVVGFAIALLQVRTPSLPLGQSALVGILGLGLAGICGAVCPDQHFLRWWSGAGVGRTLSTVAGLAVSALCFGLVTAFFFGGVSAFLILAHRGRLTVRPPLPAAMLLVLLAPGVALQSIGTSLGVFVGWMAGAAAGAFVGVSVGIWTRARLSSTRRAS